mgnify:CR=1 FL=1
MNGLTTVTTKGQVTIPEPIRSALGILVGDKVRFERIIRRNKKIIATVVPARIVGQTYGSIRSRVKEVSYHVAKQKAGVLLGQKYSPK